MLVSAPVLITIALAYFVCYGPGVGYWVQGLKGLLAKGYPLPCGLQKILAVLALPFVLFIAVSVRLCRCACVGPFTALLGKCTSSHIQ